MVIQRFLTAIALCLFTPCVFAAVSAQLSAQNIDELETVRLTIKITETRQSETLDLTALEKDFHIMNTNTVSQSRFLNGRGVSWVDYQINLQPKRTGVLTIPSIKVGVERTPSLELNVKKLSEQTRKAISELVFFENEISASSIYVQSQLVLTRRLLYSQGVQLYSDLPGAPELNDAVVLTLGETSSTSTTRNGKPYGVVEQRYAIFPETSGTFVIPGISITASVRLIENNRTSRKGVRVGTPDETIEVLGVPASYPADQPWLPAQNIELLEVVTPDEQAHNVGDTLTHELLTRITGNIGSSAAPQTETPDSESFRVYPAAPVINDDTTGGLVKGARLQTQSLIPLKPGLLQLPKVRVTWWDTLNKTVRVTESSGITLSVVGTAIDTAVAVVPPPETQSTQTPTLPVSEAQPIEVTWQTIRAYLPLGALVLFLVALALLVARYKANLTNWHTRNNTSSKSLAIAQQSLSSGNLSDIHNSVVRYLGEHFQCSAIDVQRKLEVQSAPAASALSTLTQHLYGSKSNSQSTNPDPLETDLSSEDQTSIINELRSALQQIARDRQDTPSQPDLPELYAN